MLHRRQFLRSSVAFGLGLPLPAPNLRAYDRTLATTDNLELLGRPRSWSLVRQGLHPISPERVVIVTDKGGDGRLGRDKKREDRLRAKLRAAQRLSSAKFVLCIRLMNVLTAFYRVPHLHEKWRAGLTRREALASTGMGYGFGLLHQFQDDGAVQLANSPIDWWLFLFPNGGAWDAWDGEPVYGMIGHVFPPHHYELAGLKLRVWELTSRVAWTVIGEKKDVAGWRRLSRLDRITAAREVSHAILDCASD